MPPGRCAGPCVLIALCATGIAAAQDIREPRERIPAGAVRLRPTDSAGEPRPIRPGPSATAPVPIPRPTTSTRPTAPTRTRDLVIPLEVEGQTGRPITADKLRVSSGKGKITSAEDGAPQLEMPVGESAIVSTDTAQEVAARDMLVERAKMPLPWLVVETEAGAEGATVRTARPFVTLAKAILWKPEQKRHVAEFLFGLDPETGAPGPLDHPLSVRFVVTCDDVQPVQTRVESIGPEGYGTVNVECSPAIKNERPRHELGIFVERGNLRYPFRIPRRMGPPGLTGYSGELPGFGFSALTLTVSSLEEDGSPLSVRSDTRFQLNAEGGRIDVSEATIPAGQHQTSVEIHPHGLGTIEVRAAHGSLSSPPVKLELRWPVMPLFAIFAGGPIGGFLTTLRDKTRRNARRRVLEGAIVGLVASGLALLVPSFTTLPGWAPRTELGLFVIAALAGFLGTPLLERAAAAVFPKAQNPTE